MKQAKVWTELFNSDKILESANKFMLIGNRSVVAEWEGLKGDYKGS